MNDDVVLITRKTTNSPKNQSLILVVFPKSPHLHLFQHQFWHLRIVASSQLQHMIEGKLLAHSMLSWNEVLFFLTHTR